MKTQILLSCLLAGGFAVAQGPVYTTPVGYVTEELSGGGEFNLVGLTLHNPTILSGTLTGVTDESVDVGTDPDLELGNTYLLEITSGLIVGATVEVTSWTGSLLDTAQDLEAVGLEQGDAFSLRKAATISGVFGEENESGLLSGSSSTADLIWVLNEAGGFDRYYYAEEAPPFITEGWKKAGSGDADFGDAVISFQDSIFVQRRATEALDLVVSGEVKLSPSSTTIVGDENVSVFNYMGAVFPVGLTLGDSGLDQVLKAGASLEDSDVVWLRGADGSYTRYYVSIEVPPFVTAGWKRAGSGDTDFSGTEIGSAFLVQRRPGNDATVTILPPPSYQN